jgi:hypothetical protein
MTAARIRNIVAGLFIMLSVTLAVTHSIHWLWFTLFVGANLFQSGITNWCLMDKILTRLGVPATPAG